MLRHMYHFQNYILAVVAVVNVSAKEMLEGIT
jgi:hypothetical protein